MPVDIRLKRGNRGLLLGRTGSGKTMLALWLLRFAHFGQLFFFDTKGDPEITKFFDPAETVIVPAAGISSAEVREKEIVIVRPTGEEITDGRPVDHALDFVYGLGDNTVCIDEAGQLGQTTTRIGKGLANVLTRGRSRKVTLLAGSQRPSRISTYFYTESEQFYIFSLTDLRDRKRVHEFIPDGKVLEPVKRHYFLYYETTMDNALLVRPIPPIKPWKPAPLEQAAEEKRGERFFFV